MKKKSIIALLLACSFAFGTAAFTGCDIIGGTTGDQNQTQGGDKDENKTPGTTTDDGKKDPVQTPGDGKEDGNKDPVQNPDDGKEDENKDPVKDPDDGKDPGDNKDPDDKNPGGDEEKDPPVTYREIKFYNDGVLVETKSVKDGEKVTAPTNVSKTGYSLTGWGTSSASGANFDFTQGVTSNLNLHAKWAPVNDKVSYLYAGNECAAFEWKDSNPAGATVQYKLSTDSSYKTVDSALVRASTTSDIAGTARVDVVGLKGGANYDFKITPSNGSAFTVNSIAISAYDRSGYAHFGKSDGVGAYKDDGTVKSNAKIYYVTENNKNNIDGNGTSLAELLENSSNGTANTLRNSTPIVIRVIGMVKCPQYLSANNLDSSIPDIDGITRTDQGNDSYWNMIDVKEGSNITVEGIGEDATIFQFGFTWKKCSSIEVRNLTFTDYPEDACSFEGDTNSPSSYKYIWLHHSVFNIGKNGWDKTDEQDKHDGDGASDLKGVSNVTFSYLQYNGCHKTGLVGGDDKHLTSNVTFHHNYYNGNQQRLPLGRQANMHMYNNYYYKSTMYSISLRANAYAFIENNYFDNSNGRGTIEIRNSDKVANYGYGKLFNNKFANENKKGFQKYVSGQMQEFDGGNYIVEVSSRTQTVANTNTFNQNFDTDSSAFYYDSTNKKSDVTLMLTAEQTKELVPQLAGVQKRGGNVNLGGTTGTGTGSGTGTETPDPNPNPNPNPNPGDETGETKTVLIINDFSGANEKATYDIVLSGDAAGYLTGNKITASKSGGNMSLGGDNGLKIQSATKLDFTCSNSVKLVIKLANVSGKDNKILLTKGSGTAETLTADADFNIVIELEAGASYQIGRTNIESIVASISIIVPA